MKTAEKGFDASYMKCRVRVEDNRIIKIHANETKASDDALNRRYEGAKGTSMFLRCPEKGKEVSWRDEGRHFHASLVDLVWCNPDKKSTEKTSCFLRESRVPLIRDRSYFKMKLTTFGRL